MKLNNVNCFTSLFDGSTDAAMLYKQMSYVQYSDRTLLGINKVEIIQELFTLSKVDNSHADGVEKNKKFLRKES